jgi:hypothetical protein
MVRSMTLQWRYVWLILPPMLVGIGGELLIALFGADGPAYTGLVRPPASPAMVAAERGARLTMLAFLLLLIFISAGIVTKFALDIRRGYKRSDRGPIYAAAGIAVATALVIVGATELGIIKDGIELLGPGLFSSAAALAETYGEFETVQVFATIAAIATGAGIVALAVGAVSCLGEGGPGEDEDAVWKRQSERLQLYVYLGTAMLVSGILFIEAWSHWPNFAFALDSAGKSAEREAYASHSNALTIYNGVQYSVMLAAFALPAAAALFARAEDIARRKLAPEATQDEVDKAKEGAGLSITLMNQIKALVMIIMPFLASTFDKLLGLLGGGS